MWREPFGTTKRGGTLHRELWPVYMYAFSPCPRIVTEGTLLVVDSQNQTPSFAADAPLVI